EAGFERQYLKSAALTSTKSDTVNSVLGLATNSVADSNPPSNTDVLNILLDDIAAKVTRRIARTKGTLDFRLPGGALRAYNDKMRNKEWVALYDDLYTMKEPTAPEDRAERLHWLGISKEATAYDTKDATEARKALLDADRHYQDAAAV